ncbi:ankyrin repeat-containing domain protein, partial [Baffinella frigidus]
MAATPPLTPALWTAAQAGQTEAVRKLLTKGAAIEERGGPLESSPLHAACSKGHAGVVQLLLEHKADASTKATDGDTPLHDAVLGDHEAVVVLLLENGADASAPGDGGGQTPLHHAVQMGFEGVVQLLL